MPLENFEIDHVFYLYFSLNFALRAAKFDIRLLITSTYKNANRSKIFQGFNLPLLTESHLFESDFQKKT
jgi:hypothetical protein